MTLKDMTHQQVIMHRLRRDLGDRLVGHLDISEMFRCSGLGVRNERSATNIDSPGNEDNPPELTGDGPKTDLLFPSQPQPGDVPELREISLHLVLVEPMRDSAEVEDSFFFALWEREGSKRGDEGWWWW